MWGGGGGGCTRYNAHNLIKTIRNRFPPPPTSTTTTTPYSVKIFPATSQSSSTQTAEPIVKCHTILKMGSHDLSPHTFRSGPQFWKGLLTGVKKNCLTLIFCHKFFISKSDFAWGYPNLNKNDSQRTPQASEAKEGLPGCLKATSPRQELEVGSCRPPYLLV